MGRSTRQAGKDEYHNLASALSPVPEGSNLCVPSTSLRPPTSLPDSVLMFSARQSSQSLPVIL